MFLESKTPVKASYNLHGTDPPGLPIYSSLFLNKCHWEPQNFQNQGKVLTCACACACVCGEDMLYICGHSFPTMHVWRSEHKWNGFFLLPNGFWSQVFRVSDKCLYLLNQPLLHILKQVCPIHQQWRPLEVKDDTKQAELPLRRLLQ